MFKVGDKIRNKICNTMHGTLIHVYGSLRNVGVVRLDSDEELVINFENWFLEE